jgi:hypothetical protein
MVNQLGMIKQIRKKKGGFTQRPKEKTEGTKKKGGRDRNSTENEQEKESVFQVDESSIAKIFCCAQKRAALSFFFSACRLPFLYSFTSS